MAKVSDKKIKTSTEMEPNMATALVYAPFFGWVAAIVFLIVEKYPSIRWNSVQALLLAAGLYAIRRVLGMFSILASMAPLVFMIEIVLDLALAVMAYQSRTVRLPYVSEWTDKLAKKI